MCYKKNKTMFMPNMINMLKKNKVMTNINDINLPFHDVM